MEQARHHSQFNYKPRYEHQQQQHWRKLSYAKLNNKMIELIAQCRKTFSNPIFLQTKLRLLRFFSFVLRFSRLLSRKSLEAQHKHKIRDFISSISVWSTRFKLQKPREQQHANFPSQITRLSSAIQLSLLSLPPPKAHQFANCIFRFPAPTSKPISQS